MKETIEISNCYYNCPLWGDTMDGMACTHPYWKTQGAWDNMIITQQNSKDRVPDKCPLRKEELITILRLKGETKSETN